MNNEIISIGDRLADIIRASTPLSLKETKKEFRSMSQNLAFNMDERRTYEAIANLLKRSLK